MTRMRAFLATLMLSTPLSVMAAEDPVTTFVLDNGMQVIVVEDHRAPVVQHMVWYRAGSADEPKGASGVAHFLEHLLFKATDKLEAGEFSAIVSANGGNDNAFTSYDYTAYYQRIAADRLELMMGMESDRMRNIRLTPANIETERDVIIEERNQRTENSASALFSEQMRAVQYHNHRYGVPVIGWMHEMETLNLDDALSFYEIYYSPNNAILVVSGDVTPEGVRELAEKYYGVIPFNPALPERLRTEEPPQTAERRVIFRDSRVAQPYVSRSYLAPERDQGAQKEAAALTLLAEILGGGTTSYLTDTTFNMIVVPAPGVTLQGAEDAMDVAVASFMKEGVDPAQLERLKKQLRAQQIYARDNVDGIAQRYGSALTTGLTVEDVQAWPEILQAITPEEIMAAAEKVIIPETSVTGWLMKVQEQGQ